MRSTRAFPIHRVLFMLAARDVGEAGVPAELHVLEGMWHDFALQVPHEGGLLLGEMLAGFDRHLTA